MIRLKQLLQETYIPESKLKELAQEMGETIVDYVGSGANGKAYETASGRILKLTEDPAEVALASRLRTKRLFKHIINVYDVRPIEGADGSYLILQDKLEDILGDHATWGYTWNYLRNKYFGKEMTDKQLRDWIIRTDDQWIKFDMTFIDKIMPQRAGLKRDFSELRIVPDEAHANNMGWNKFGNLVHFDAWQREHYSKTSRKRFNGEPMRTSTGTIDTDINQEPYQRGINKPLQGFNNK